MTELARRTGPPASSVRARSATWRCIADAHRRAGDALLVGRPACRASPRTNDWLDLDDRRASAEASDDFVVTLDGEVIGKIGAWQLPEIGFILRSDQRGRGYAARSDARVPRRDVFDSTGVELLTADVDPRNSGVADGCSTRSRASSRTRLRGRHIGPPTSAFATASILRARSAARLAQRRLTLPPAWRTSRPAISSSSSAICTAAARPARLADQLVDRRPARW